MTRELGHRHRPTVRTSPSDEGTIPFNELIATTGVRSIELNGFVLTDQVSPAVDTPTGIFLFGGVRVLSFDGILAQIDSRPSRRPTRSSSASGNTPLKVQPSIYLNSIQDLVFNQTGTTIDHRRHRITDADRAVHRQRHAPELRHHVRDAGARSRPASSSSSRSWEPPAGRPCRRRRSRTSTWPARRSTSPCRTAAQPFSSESSGVSYLKKATFGGVADGVGLDVDGPIGTLKFKRGPGQSQRRRHRRTNQPAPGSSCRPRMYGYTEGSTGYPAAGDLGGVVSATSIHKLVVGPANYLHADGPESGVRPDARAGLPRLPDDRRATPSAMRSSPPRGRSTSPSSTARCTTPRSRRASTTPPTSPACKGRGPASHIGQLDVNGSLVNSDISATFRPANNHYSRATGVGGPGSIKGTVTGSAI